MRLLAFIDAKKKAAEEQGGGGGSTATGVSKNESDQPPPQENENKTAEVAATQNESTTRLATIAEVSAGSGEKRSNSPDEGISDSSSKHTTQ